MKVPIITLAIVAVLLRPLMAADCDDVLPDGVYNRYKFKKEVDIYYDLKKHVKSSDFEQKADKGDINIASMGRSLGLSKASSSDIRKAAETMTEEQWHLFVNVLMQNQEVNEVAYDKYVDCLRGGLSASVVTIEPKRVIFHVSYWVSSKNARFPVIKSITSSSGKHTTVQKEGKTMESAFSVTVQRNNAYEPAWIEIDHDGNGDPVHKGVEGAGMQTFVRGTYAELATLLNTWGDRGFAARGLVHAPGGKFEIPLSYVGKKATNKVSSSKSGTIAPWLKEHPTSDGWENYNVQSLLSNAQYLVSSRVTKEDPI